MKKIKVIACVLTVAMLAGIFAGCSKTTKISTDKFAKACERLKLSEIDIEDDMPDDDDLEDGFYIIVDEDLVEDQSDRVEDMLDEYGLADVIDADDVKSMGLAVKMSGLEDIEDIEDPEDIEDVKVDGAFAAVIELDENYVKDVMDYVEDMLDTYDIDVKDLSNKEYFVSKNDGFIRFHIDVSKLTKIILENDDIMELIGEVYDEDDFEDLCKNLSGDIAITIEINGSNIFILAGGSLNTKPSTLNSFASAFGANNPIKIPMNNKFVEDLIQDTIDNYGDLAGAYSGGYDYDDYDYDYDYDDYDDWDYDDDDI